MTYDVLFEIIVIITLDYLRR